MVKLQGVSKYYKTKTGVSEGMRNINLEFKLNEFVAITGESGSGKTTLLNVISGLDTYEDGELFVNGLETSHYTVKEWEEFRAENIGFIFQNYNVIDSYSVYQNVIIALEAQGYNESDKKQQALDLIDKVGLSSHIHHKTSKLSGGQKQRVVIARALAKNAPIILADEPTGNLDEQSGKEILQLLKDISKDKLIILVTHNFLEAKPFVTRNIVMADGIIKDDKPVNKSEYDLLDGIIKKEDNKKNPFVVSSKMATRNLISTPKRSVFSILLSMVAISIFVMFYSLLIKNNAGVSSTAYNSYGNIIHRDGSDFSGNDVKDFKKKYGNKTLSFEVRFTDYTAYEDAGDGYIGRKFSIASQEGIKSDEYYGELPKNENEIMIYSNTVYFELGYEFEDISIRNIHSGETSIPKTYTIVGILYNDYAGKRNDHSDHIIFYDEYLYDDNYNLNKDFFIGDNQISNLIVIGPDRQEIKLLKDRIDNDKYQFMDDYLYYEQDDLMINSILVIFFWVILIGILSIVFLVLYNVFKNVMESRKKDFAVYRSIGVTEKEVALTILIEQVILSLIASLLTISILELLSNFNDFIRSIVRHITLGNYIFMALIFAFFSLLQGLRFNKRIFKITVIESLREDN